MILAAFAVHLASAQQGGKRLYVTACDHVYRIRLKVAGVIPGPESYGCGGRLHDLADESKETSCRDASS